MTLAISWGSAIKAVVPWDKTARPNSSRDQKAAFNMNMAVNQPGNHKLPLLNPQWFPLYHIVQAPQCSLRKRRISFVFYKTIKHIDNLGIFQQDITDNVASAAMRRLTAVTFVLISFFMSRGIQMIPRISVSNKYWEWAGTMTTAVSAPFPEPPTENDLLPAGRWPASIAMVATSTQTFIPAPTYAKSGQ